MGTMAPHYTLAEGKICTLLYVESWLNSLGCPYASNITSIQVRNGLGGGLVLLQDTQLIETLAHFSRERIPERTFLGIAIVTLTPTKRAFGVFEVTHNCTDITSASFLSTDTVRDVYGWAMKLYTDQGNLAWVFNNTPIFFIRDPIKFPSLNRSHKRHPQTNMTDANMVISNFHVGNPGGIHEILHLFSDRGTPASIRHMNAYSGDTYKFTKEDGSFKYVKIHIKSHLGVANLTREAAVKLADLYDAIERGSYPIYNVYVQVMDPREAETYKWNIFDMTRVWPHKDFPLRQIGRLTLTRNPRNYFVDIEQASFSPSTMVPGFAPSADPVLQARLFAYPDAARYRLGVNYQQLPTNASRSPVYCPFERDGFMNFSENYGDDPNYFGSSLRPTTFATDSQGKGRVASTLTEHEKWVGEVCSFTTHIAEEDFEQAAALWEVLGRESGHQERFIGNVADHLRGVTDSRLRNMVYDLFSRVNSVLGDSIQIATEASV
ncbi:catalase-like domain-containing protein [Lipomyces starkeyi]